MQQPWEKCQSSHPGSHNKYTGNPGFEYIWPLEIITTLAPSNSTNNLVNQQILKCQSANQSGSHNKHTGNPWI